MRHMLSVSAISCLALAAVASPPASAAGKEGTVKIGKAAGYNPVTDPANFVDAAGDPLPIENAYFPLEPGTTFHYEGVAEEGLDTDDVYVTHDTKTILDVACVVVHDTERLDGLKIEDTYDWYAQDRDGNVWYFGEDSTQYQGDPAVAVGHEGSWEAGENGAKPGIIMLADPLPGDSYREEYAADVAEDMARVMRLNAKVTVPYGVYLEGLETKEWSPLEPGAVEQKFYAAGVGNVLVIEHQGKALREELVSISFD